MNIPFGEILFLIVLTFFEAIFVAAEIALVSIRRSRVEQMVDEGRPGARRVQRLLQDPGRFLAVSQLGLTFIGFLASAYAAVSLSQSLASLLAGVGMDAGTADGVSLVIVTVILALFTIVFAELVPKTLALAHPERFALTLAGPLDVLGADPSRRSSRCSRRSPARSRALFGVDVSAEAQITAEELRLIVERGGEQGILEAEEEQMINAVIELGDRRLHEVMVPRIAIVALPASSTFDEAVDRIIDEGHSRLPVYETSVDEVVGILYAKDLLPFLKSSSDAPSNLRAMLRTPVFVPESMTIDDLLHEFQRRKVHIAIVLDEYGGTAGLVTIEDLLEEIVGEIQDEYDVEEPLVEMLGRPLRTRRRPGVGRRPARPVGHQARARGRGRVRHGRRPRVPPDRRHPAAGRRDPRGRPAAHRGDDRRPPGGQGARRPRARRGRPVRRRGRVAVRR